MPDQVIFVIGMHRSGTSLTMQALSALGVGTDTDLLPPDEHNANGYWEATEVVGLHNDLLDTLGRKWGSPEHLIPLDGDFETSDVGQSACVQAKRILSLQLERASDQSTLAIKDPRLSLFLPIWVSAAKSLSLTCRVVLCLRHPGEVARSLAKRDELAIEMGEALWLRYTLDSIRNSSQLPTFVSKMTDWQRQPEQKLQALSEFIGVHGAEVRSPFEQKLIHATDANEVSDPLVAEWWSAVSELGARDQISDELIARAQVQTDMARHLSVLAKAVRDEVGETPTYLAQRTSDAFKAEADGLRRRVFELADERDAFKDAFNETRAAYEKLRHKFRYLFKIRALLTGRK